MLASLPRTQMKLQGVLSVADTLLTHDGKHCEKIAYLYDHTQRCDIWAHNLVNLPYSDDQTDYRAHRKLLIAQQLLTQFFSEHRDRHLPVTCDNWYTQPAFGRFLDQT
jgi:hypothetical protein